MKCPILFIRTWWLLPLALGDAILAQSAPPQETSITERLKAEAENLKPLVESRLALGYLAAVADLAEVSETRVVLYNKTTRAALTQAEAGTKTHEELEGFQQLELDPTFYYTTRYGSPLAYVCALDIAAKAGFETADGARIADFGFGGVGTLRLLAGMGAEALGIDVDPLLMALYSEPGDRGRVPRARAAGSGQNGKVQMVFGRFPGIADEVGKGFDLFISKNTLKRGYLHPPPTYERGALIDLGCDDETWLGFVRGLLKPGGLFLIYNLAPAQSQDPASFIPWADGRAPFEKELFERMGFEVLAYDVDQTEKAHAVAKALGWEKDMDIENDLFALYTLVRKKGEP